jgi:hypothetical protein
MLAPDVVSTIGNPVLTIDASGTGTLSFDVAWSVSADTASDGYRRLVVATFGGADVQRAGESFTISATPDYAGREYVSGGTVSPASYPAEFIDWYDPAMRAWWYQTGASMDAEKVPNPFTVGFTAVVPVDEEPGSGTPPVTGEPGTAPDVADSGDAEPVDAAEARDGLADTGLDAALPMLGAGVMLLGGALLVVLRRRRVTR